MFRLPLLIVTLFTVLTLSATSSDPVAIQKPKESSAETPVTLWVKHDSCRPRKPVQQSLPDVIGFYSDGIISLIIEEPGSMQLSIVSNDMETYYTCTSDELLTGISIGEIDSFSITLTTEYGLSYIGEVNL